MTLFSNTTPKMSKNDEIISNVLKSCRSDRELILQVMNQFILARPVGALAASGQPPMHLLSNVSCLTVNAKEGLRRVAKVYLIELGSQSILSLKPSDYARYIEFFSTIIRHARHFKAQNRTLSAVITREWLSCIKNLASQSSNLDFLGNLETYLSFVKEGYPFFDRELIITERQIQLNKSKITDLIRLVESRIQTLDNSQQRQVPCIVLSAEESLSRSFLTSNSSLPFHSLASSSPSSGTSSSSSANTSPSSSPLPVRRVGDFSFFSGQGVFDASIDVPHRNTFDGLDYNLFDGPCFFGPGLC